MGESKLGAARSKHAAVKEQVQNAEVELEKLQQRKQALFKQMRSGRKRISALIDFADEEIKKAQSEKDPERKARLINLNELRKLAAAANLDLLDLISSLDITKAPPPTFVGQVESLALRVQFITMEYNLLNYQPVLAMLQQAFDGKAGAAPTESSASTATAAGPGRPGTAPMPGARPGMAAPGARPGMPGARPGMPTPGAGPAGPGRGPLSRPAPAAGATGPLSARAAAAGARPGTGPVPPGGTGRLQGRSTGGTGKLQADAELQEALRVAVQDADTKRKLYELVSRVQDLEMGLAPLRGEALGQLNVAPEAVGNALRQLSGKVYYIGRTLSTLGPLAAPLSFVGESADPAVDKLLASIGDDTAEDLPPPAPEPAATQQTSLSERLKSLFKT